MYELIQAAGDSYYIDCPAKIGLVRIGDNEVALIDSGSDKDAGRKVRQILDRNGWRLRAIYNTHSNADHIGGNAYLQRQTGCRIFSPGAECCFTRYPYLEPTMLYGGWPCKDLRHKFLMAEESEAECLTEESLAPGMSIIPLPGHFLEMAGYRTADDVVYLADCLSSRETLDKYGITFIYDVGAYLDTLERVSRMEARLFVPSHAAACDDITGLAEYNVRKVHEVEERIFSICREPSSTETIMQRLFISYGLCMDMQQHVLVGSTVRSYLAWMKDSGRLDAEFDDCMLLWRQA